MNYCFSRGKNTSYDEISSAINPFRGSIFIILIPFALNAQVYAKHTTRATLALMTSTLGKNGVYC